MNLIAVLGTSTCIRLTLALAHFLWQGLLLGLVAALLMVLLRRAAATTRYNVLVALLLLMAACPVATWCRVELPVPPAVPARGPASTELVPGGISARDALPPLPVGADVPFTAPAIASPQLAPPNSATPVALFRSFWTQRDWQRLAPLVSGIYLLGAGLMLARLLLGLQGGRRLCRRSVPVDDPALRAMLVRQAAAVGLRCVPLLAFCRQVAVPTVVGILRPTILLPFSLASGLAPEQIETVLTHELAHIRRYDHLVNLVQRIVEAALFFHPAVWFVAHRIRAEREHCCDDRVVALGAQPVAYAASLLQVAEWSRSVAAADLVPNGVGLQASGPRSRLGRRIVRLLGEPDEPRLRLTRGSFGMLALVTTLALAAPMLLHARTEPAAKAIVKEAPNRAKDPAPEAERTTVAADRAEAKNVAAAAMADDVVIGTVVGSDDQPQANIEVLVFQGDRRFNQAFHTDAQGQFRVPKEWRTGDEHYLLVAHDGHERLGWFDFFLHAHSDAGQKTSDGSFRLVLLPMTHGVQGQLVDRTGRPLDGIAVRIESLNHPVNLASFRWYAGRSKGSEALLAEAVSGPDGRFRSTLPQGASGWLRPIHADWVSKRIQCTADHADLGQVILSPSAKIHGRVIDARSGAALAGVGVAAQAVKPEIETGGWGDAVTDANGRYVIGGLAPGAYNVLLLELADRTLTAPAHAAVKAEASRTLTADFPVAPGRRLTGKVLDAATSEPIADCTVGCYGASRPKAGAAVLFTKTDRTGRFDFFVPPGSSYVYIADLRETNLDSSREVIVPPEGDLDLGILRAGPKQPPESLKVFINESINATPARETKVWGKPQGGWQTGFAWKSGRAELPAGQPAEFEIRVKCVGPAPVKVPLRTPSWRDLTLEANKALQIRVHGYEAATLDLAPGEERVLTIPGAYVPTEGLPPGRYMVEVSAPVGAEDQRLGPLALRILPAKGAAAGASYPAAPMKDPRPIAWGQPALGLQAGIRFAEGQTKHRLDEAIIAEVFLRNLTERAIDVEYHHPTPLDFVPLVVTEHGKRLEDLLLPTGPKVQAKRTLKPRETVSLGNAQFSVESRRSDQWNAPQVFGQPGRYRYSTWIHLGQTSVAVGIGLRLETGVLPLEIEAKGTAATTQAANHRDQPRKAPSKVATADKPHPTSTPKGSPTGPTVVIRLLAQGNGDLKDIRVGETSMGADIGQLAGALRAEFSTSHERLTIRIEAEPQLRYQTVARVVQEAQAIGVTHIGLFNLSAPASATHSAVRVRVLDLAGHETDQVQLTLWRKLAPDEKPRDVTWIDKAVVRERNRSWSPDYPKPVVFGFDGLGAGVYRLTATHDARQADRDPTPVTASEPFSLDGTNVVQLALQLAGNTPLVVQVRDRQTGQPISAAMLRLFRGDGMPIVHGHGSGNFFDRTFDDGSFRYARLLPGRYLVEVTGPPVTTAHSVNYRTAWRREVIVGQEDRIVCDLVGNPLSEAELDERWPHSVRGRVTDADGRPMEGVRISAHRGIGTLRETAATLTDRDGRYLLRFGPGIGFNRSKTPAANRIQAALITAHKNGYFEKNMSRQGNLAMADVPPAPELVKGYSGVVVPGERREINFTMVPAAKVAGTLLDKNQKPLAGYKVALTGKELPPGCSVIESVATNAQGQFQIRNIPTGYRFQFLVEPARSEPPWVAWASPPFEFHDPGQQDVAIISGTTMVTADRFSLLLVGDGENWRSALEHATLLGPGIEETNVLRGEVRTEAKELRGHELRLQLGTTTARAAVKPPATSADQRLFEGKTLRVWIQQLADPDPRSRLHAAEAIGAFGSEARAAIPALIKALSDNGPQVAVTARRALTRIGPKAVPALTAALEKENNDVRWWAAQALGEIGPSAAAAIPALIAALHDRSEAVRDTGAPEALGKIGPAAIPALLVALRDADAFVRAGAVRALGRMGPPAKTAVPRLLELLNDRNQPVKTANGTTFYPVCFAAATALGQIGAEPQAAVPALVTLLGDGNAWLRQTAIEALTDFGPAARTAVPALLTALNDKGEEVAVRAAMALGAIGPAAAPAVPALIEYLGRLDGDENGARRGRVATALAAIGPEATEPLMTALKGPNQTLRARVAPALAALASRSRTAADQILPAFITALENSDTAARCAVLAALGRLGPRAAPAVPAISHALADPNEAIRLHAAQALFGNVTHTNEAVPALIQVLKDQEYSIRLEAAWALFAIGPPAKAALPGLQSALHDQEKDVRSVARRAIARISADPTEAMMVDPWRARLGLADN